MNINSSIYCKKSGEWYNLDNERKEVRKYLLRSLALLIGATLFACLVFNLITAARSQQVLDEVGDLYMHGMSEEIALHFETTIDLRLDQIKSIIHDIPPEKGEIDENTKERLSYEGTIRSFDYLAFYDVNGDFQMIYGEQVELEDKRSFFDSISRGDEKVAVGHSESDKKIVIMGIPVRYDLGGGKTSIGITAGVTAEYINTLLNLNESDDSLTYSHIIRRDGSFVIKNSDISEDNYFDRLSKMYNPSDTKGAERSLNRLKTALNEHKQYSEILHLNDDRRHIYVVPLAKSEWNLVTVMPYGVLDDTIKGLDKTRTITFICTVAFIITVTVIVFLGYFGLTNKQLAAIQKARLEAEHATKAKSEFLSNMSHDIRTPMNAIVGMTAIASANIDNKQQVENCLRKITLSGKHLLGLINDILDMSKIESGKMTLSMTEVSLREVMDSIVCIVQPQVKSKKLRFDVLISNISDENVYCDSVRLNQVILNLLSNAVKFTQDGGQIEVKLYEEPSERGDNYTCVHLEVKDNGIGMTEEFQKTIFDAFSREDSKRVHKTEGTGLGMAITKYIVDAMGGTIRVESAPGKGTHFFVTLDLEIADVLEEDMILPNWKMLVVDDDEQVCRSTANSLENIGINAEWVLDGETAVKKVEECQNTSPYHIILLDWKLPGIDGIETANRIRQRLGNDIPILLISAYDWSEIEEDAKKAGISGFISKPLFRSTLFYGLKKYAGSELPSDSTAKQDEDNSTHFNGTKILLAEDNELNWEIANELLSERGLDIDHAENGEICVNMFDKSEAGYYKAILMDIRMPVMSGYEATEKIRALDRADKDIPIIAMTADAFSEDVKKCLDAGMDAHTTKPIDVEAVAKLLKKYIKE